MSESLEKRSDSKRLKTNETLKSGSIINLTNDPRIVDGIKVPDEGFLCVTRVPVNPQESLSEAVQRSCPQTRPDQFPPDVARFYPPVNDVPKTWDIFMLGTLALNHNVRKLEDFMGQNHLSNATPRQIYAVAAQHPDLQVQLEKRDVEILSLDTFKIDKHRRVCSAILSAHGPTASIPFLDLRTWGQEAIFAFARESRNHVPETAQVK